MADPIPTPQDSPQWAKYQRYLSVYNSATSNGMDANKASQTANAIAKTNYAPTGPLAGAAVQQGVKGVLGGSSTAGTGALASDAAASTVPQFGGEIGAQALPEYLSLTEPAAAETAAAPAAAATEAAAAETSLAGTEGLGGIAANAGEMGAGPIAAIIAATALGGRYGLRNLQGKTKNWKDASLADNAGRVALGMATFGGSELFNFAKNKFFNQKSTKELQRDRDNALLKQGVTGYADYLKQRTGGANHNGKQAEGLGADFQGYDSKQQWANNKFAGSRNEGDLKFQDIVGSNLMFENYGNDWLGKLTENQRNTIADKWLEKGLVREKKGGLYGQGDYKGQAKAIMDEVLGMKSGLKTENKTNSDRPLGFDKGKTGKWVRRANPKGNKK